MNTIDTATLASPLSVFVKWDNGNGFTYDERTWFISKFNELVDVQTNALAKCHPFFKDLIEAQFSRAAITVLRGDTPSNSFRMADGENDMVEVFIAAGTHGIKF
jgi:hypothetical protein